MVVKEEEERDEVQIKKILLPIDGSEASRKAARYAIRLAKTEGAEIICIHAIITPPYLGYKGSGALAREFDEEAKRSAEKWFADIKGMAAEHGKGGVVVAVKTDILMDAATISDAIVDYADRIGADMIVIGTRGRGAAKRLLLGSVAQGVAVHAHCPVLIVR